MIYLTIGTRKKKKNTINSRSIVYAYVNPSILAVFYIGLQIFEINQMGWLVDKMVLFVFVFTRRFLKINMVAF